MAPAQPDPAPISFFAARHPAECPTDFERDYDVEPDVLGKGANAVVRKAVCRQTGATVAVKSYEVPKLPARAWKDLQKEIEVHTSIEHQHVLRLDRVYQNDGAVHMVLERLEGGELLHAVLRRKQFSEADAIDVVQQVLKAVDYLHTNKVVHRDIKLENIMYTSEDSTEVKLIDYGLAIFWDGKAKMTHKCGTRAYVAPELVAGAYTEKADMWSLGVVVYALLTGKTLYTGSDEQVSQKEREGKPDFSEKFHCLSDEAKDFVRWLLTVDPEKRPSASEAMTHPWLQGHRPGSCDKQLPAVTSPGGRGKLGLRAQTSLTEAATTASSPEAATAGPEADGTAGDRSFDAGPGGCNDKLKADATRLRKSRSLMDAVQDSLDLIIGKQWLPAGFLHRTSEGACFTGLINLIAMAEHAQDI